MIEFIDQGRDGVGPAAPVTIIQEEAEFAQLLALYCERKPSRVLEVGTYAGGTLFQWLQHAEPGTLVVSLDLYEEKDNSSQYPSWCAPGVTFEVIRGDSTAKATADEAARFAPFEWVFIDACHLEENIRADWSNYGPLAAPDGIVAFHDIIETEDFPTLQVYRLWRELSGRYETREIWGGGSGIGVLVVPEEGIV